MKFSQLTQARRHLNHLAMEKEAGVLGMAARGAMAPVKMVGKGLWGASKRSGGPFAPLIFGGAVLGGGAALSKGVNQAKNYAHGFNPQLQESLVRS